jgi:head-tail adaptor
MIYSSKLIKKSVLLWIVPAIAAAILVVNGKNFHSSGREMSQHGKRD